MFSLLKKLQRHSSGGSVVGTCQLGYRHSGVLAHAPLQPRGSLPCPSPIDYLHLTISPLNELSRRSSLALSSGLCLIQTRPSSREHPPLGRVNIDNTRPNTPHRHLPTPPPPLSTHDSNATMTADLTTVLLQFQPEAEELKSRQKYDQAARQFVTQLNNISASHWSKGADTPQDVLEVGRE